MAKSKRRGRKDKVSIEHKVRNRTIKHTLFHSGQFKPQVIKNKKREKINKGFKDD